MVSNRLLIVTIYRNKQFSTQFSQKYESSVPSESFRTFNATLLPQNRIQTEWPSVNDPPSNLINSATLRISCSSPVFTRYKGISFVAFVRRGTIVEETRRKHFSLREQHERFVCLPESPGGKDEKLAAENTSKEREREREGEREREESNEEEETERRKNSP